MPRCVSLDRRSSTRRCRWGADLPLRTRVRYAARLSTTPDEIVAFVEAHQREPIDVQYLLAWIALRTDRAVHQAGERPPLERLRFVCERWLSAEERALLMV